MKSFDSRTYSISDFLEWNDSDLLILDPGFQRRPVWSQKAKSYLIDTILRGKPMPKIILKQTHRKGRNFRDVVDGQQRLRAIIEYYESDFRLSRAHNRDLSKYRYETLPENLKDAFVQYELSVDVIFEASYPEIIDIFTRMNTYTVKLNNQELLNAEYVGFFKTQAYEVSNRYLEYWLEGQIISKADVNRMVDATLASELLIALIDKIQTNKVIRRYYQDYEDEEGNIFSAAEKFDKTMSHLGAIYPPQELVATAWQRPPQFYSLFTAIAHCLFGIGGVDDSLRLRISSSLHSKIRILLDELSGRIEAAIPNKNFSSKDAQFKQYIDVSQRRTADAASRVFRAEYLLAWLKKGLEM